MPRSDKANKSCRRTPIYILVQLYSGLRYRNRGSCEKQNIEVSKYGMLCFAIGSRSDGFDLQDSDIDIMSVNQTFVVEDANISVEEKMTMSPLLIVYCSESSGYVCLKLYMKCNVDDDER